MGDIRSALREQEKIVDIATQIAVSLCRNIEYVRRDNGQTGHVGWIAVSVAKDIIKESKK